jgi:hypothetical protein
MLRSGARAGFVIGPACRPAPEGGSDWAQAGVPTLPCSELCSPSARWNSSILSFPPVLGGAFLALPDSCFPGEGTKLRRVRAQEMRAVYLNYAAFVLASYRTASSSDKRA